MIKTNIKMRVTPEQLSKISVITDRLFYEYDFKFIFIKDDGIIELNSNKEYFNKCPYYEIDADLFIKTNGTCEENATDEYYDLREALAKGKIIQLNGTAVNGGYGETWNDCKQEDLFIFSRNAYRIKDKETYLTKYTSQPKDLESALKKIENLHIALNKKVEKIKNQALEITKLLEQKKDLQEEIKRMLKHEQTLIDDLYKSQCKESDKFEEIKKLNTIISYLESKLK